MLLHWQCLIEMNSSVSNWRFERYVLATYVCTISANQTKAGGRGNGKNFNIFLHLVWACCCTSSLQDFQCRSGYHREETEIDQEEPLWQLGIISIFVIITLMVTYQVREGLGVQCEQDWPKNWTLWDPELKGAGREQDIVSHHRLFMAS